MHYFRTVLEWKIGRQRDFLRGKTLIMTKYSIQLETKLICTLFLIQNEQKAQQLLKLASKSDGNEHFSTNSSSKTEEKVHKWLKRWLCKFWETVKYLFTMRHNNKRGVAYFMLVKCSFSERSERLIHRGKANIWILLIIYLDLSLYKQIISIKHRLTRWKFYLSRLIKFCSRTKWTK